MSKNGSDIPVLWDRAKNTTSYRLIPKEPGTVVPFTGARRLDAASVLGNAAGCFGFWRRLGFERIELELEAMDLSRRAGDVGSAIVRAFQGDTLSGYCLNISGWRQSVPNSSQLARMRIYDLELSCAGSLARYGIIGDLSGPSVLLGSDLVEPLKALAAFVCEVNSLTPILAVEPKPTDDHARPPHPNLISGDALLSALADSRVVELVDHTILKLYRGVTRAIHLGGGVTPEDASGNVQFPIRLGKHLEKILDLHLK